MPKAELYIGNLGRDVSRKDIENVFDKYGRLLRCDVKNRGQWDSAFLKQPLLKWFYTLFVGFQVSVPLSPFWSSRTNAMPR